MTTKTTLASVRAVLASAFRDKQEYCQRQLLSVSKYCSLQHVSESKAELYTATTQLTPNCGVDFRQTFEPCEHCDGIALLVLILMHIFHFEDFYKTESTRR